MGNTFNFSRIIHPIGQGAFYTERIESCGKVYNIVYDCGSESNANASRILKREISSTFRHGDEITILFISHFDNDHVNGVKELLKHKVKIRNIVIPLVEENDFWFFSQEYGMEYDRFKAVYEYLCASAPKVYRVKPQSIENNDNNDDDTPVIDLSVDTQKPKEEIIDSNTLIFIDRKTIDWCYIVFNYMMDTRRQKFISNLKNEGLTEDVFRNGFDEINSNIKKIKQAYKRLCKNDGLNLSSLIVYSGGYNKGYTCISISGYCQECCIISDGIHKNLLLHNEGCLYLGDTDLNQTGLIDYLRKKLNRLYSHIVMIQLPHHGAIKNFNAQIIENNNAFYFVSYGIKNNYGHPSLSVITDIRKRGKLVYEVTENRCSYLTIILNDVKLLSILDDYE